MITVAAVTGIDHDGDSPSHRAVSFLDRWKGRGDVPPSSTSRSESGLVRLFEAHAGRSLEKRMAFEGLLEAAGGPASVAFDECVVVTKSGQRLRVQAVGADMDNRAAFMWGWSPSFQGLPAAMTRSASRLASAGRSIKVSELTADVVPLLRMPGHVAAMIACGLLGADGWHSLPLGDGSLWVTIDAGQVPIARPDVLAVSKLGIALTTLLSDFAFDPIRAFAAYAESWGFAVQPVAGGVEARISPRETASAIVTPPLPALGLPHGAKGYAFPVRIG